MLLPVWDGSHKPTRSLDHPFSLGSKPQGGFWRHKARAGLQPQGCHQHSSNALSLRGKPLALSSGVTHLRLEVGIQDISDYPITCPISQSCGFFQQSCTDVRVERQRIDVFELWCWRRLLRVPWTARRSNQTSQS